LISRHYQFQLPITDNVRVCDAEVVIIAVECVLQCDPNMAVYGVYINNLDIRLPRIALFAVRDIEKGEELTFDYKMTGESQLFPTGREG